MTLVQNPLDEVATRAKRRFPDHIVDVPFEVCLPIYEVRLKMTEIARADLSTPARFVLRLSALGTTQPEEIGRLLGISQTYVAGASVELLEQELVKQAPTLGITITDKGKQALNDGGRTFRPRNRHDHVPYDPLTKRIVDVDTRQLLHRDEVRKNGLFVLPTRPRKPRLSNIRLDEVREYLHPNWQLDQETEIIEVADVRDIHLKYRDDVIVVKLDAPNGDQSVFAAYRAQQYLVEESAEIQRLADRGAELVPEELKAVSVTARFESPYLSMEELSLLQEVDGLDQEVGDAARTVSEARATQQATQNSQERSELNCRIKVLETEKQALEKSLADKESKLEEITKGEIRLIKTEEHRHVLLKAVREATNQLTLVSAWIDPYAFDDEVSRLIAAAVGRGVQVRIAWGLGVRRRGPADSRNRAKGREVLDRLQSLVPRNLKSKLIEKITDTHEKFIICDEKFCAWGSFNWLSYRGQRDSGYRRETSSYSERPGDIALWRANADSLFG